MDARSVHRPSDNLSIEKVSMQALWLENNKIDLRDVSGPRNSDEALA